MKKSNNFKDFIKKKGFSVALYSCAAVIVALAGIISINNINSINNAKQELNQPQLEKANQSNVRSYTEKETEPVTKASNSASNENSAPEKANTEKETNKLTNNKTEAPSATESESKKSSSASTADEKIFSLFDDTKDMSWPVSGQILMDYSTETAIYDKTLDQYRTNDSICISAPVGTEVTASAEGIVKTVFKDNEYGQSVILDHGNGWLSTYSQLNENLAVKEGTVVKEGELIGYVGEPSIYKTLLGPHLEFKITKNNVATDPKLVLAQYDE